MHLDRTTLRKGRLSMKKRTKKIIFGVLSLVILAILAMVLYFYISFSGNPIERFNQQRALIKVYEISYNEDFKVVSSDYNYKRNEYSYSIYSKSNPEITFTTTLDEAGRIDKYAAARCTEYLYKIVSEALGKDFEDLQYRVNVSEEYDSPAILERDPMTRLSQNRYVVDLSWDPSVVDPLQVDAILADMTLRISKRLDTAIGGLKLRAGVWDGKNYYTTEIDTR